MVICENTVGLQIDCSQLVKDNIHAVQWYDTWGEIEFKPKDGKYFPNERITHFGKFQSYADQWVKLKVIYEEEQKELKYKIETERRNVEAIEKEAKERLSVTNDNA
jgi:hypothetical protein